MVTIVEVGPVIDEGNCLYFQVWFRDGPLATPVCRRIYGIQRANGSLWWDRIAPTSAVDMMGQDLSPNVEMIHLQGPPRTIVRFADESIEEALRRSAYASPAGVLKHLPFSHGS